MLLVPLIFVLASLQGSKLVEPRV